MIGTKRAGDNVILHVGYKLLVLLRNSIDIMRRVVWVKQHVEETVELPFLNETYVTNRHCRIATPRIWFPKCVSVGRILS